MCATANGRISAGNAPGSSITGRPSAPSRSPTLVPLLDAARAWCETHLPLLLAARRTHERDVS
ncbi:hypothetical protein ACIRVK_22900 [Streptomyces sp. NPDC101152]|uniref:hypothetical protein n=1 Tax=Streptomyces sp. NPDC101152 TaxID=3366116 RepID=UPI003822CDC2